MESSNSIAWMSVVVSTLSFLMSIVLLSWQIRKHILDGPRIQLDINTVFYYPECEIGTNESGDFTYKINHLSKGFLRGDCVELCKIIIENPGREAVTIYSPGLELEFSGRTKYFSPELYRLNIRGNNKGSTLDQDDTYRLEPYDRIVLYFDYWHIINMIRRKENARDEKIQLRGSVRVVGKNNRYQSTKTRWIINPGIYTAIEGNPRMSTYRVLLSSMSPYIPQETDSTNSVTRNSLEVVLQHAMEEFEKRPSIEEFIQALKDYSCNIYGDRKISFYSSTQAGYDELNSRGYREEDWL